MSDADQEAVSSANYAVGFRHFGRELSKDEKDIGGAVAHYVFGATTGALYGVGAELFPGVAAGVGLPFGVAVWLMADEIVSEESC